jgi:hypothetical protein
MYDFNQESYTEFVKRAQSGAQMDEYNNLTLNSDIDGEDIKDVDKFLIKVVPRKNMMNQTQIENFFDTDVSEFMDTEETMEIIKSDSEIVTEFAEEVSAEIGDQLAQEQILHHQVAELSDTLEVEIEKGVRFKEDATQTYGAAKDVIVAQRIQLGEGKTASDFSDKFPFLPKSEEDEELETDKFPFMGAS